MNDRLAMTQQCQAFSPIVSGRLMLAAFGAGTEDDS